MERRSVVALVGLQAGLYAKPAARDPFLGVWRLISTERKRNDGKVEFPYGRQPVGRLTYDNAGRMSAMVMRPGRRSSVRPGLSLIDGNASGDEIREAVDGFIAYFGTFDVDEALRTVTHHVQACLVPSWVGTDLKRTYRFVSDRLLLITTSPVGSTEVLWVKEAR